MSWQAVRAVLDHSDSYGATRLVAVAIADRADEYGENSYPGVTDLTRRAGVSRASAYRAVDALEDSGELIVDRSGRSYRFTLQLAGLGRTRAEPAAEFEARGEALGEALRGRERRARPSQGETPPSQGEMRTTPEQDLTPSSSPGKLDGDGERILAEKRKVNGRVVKPDEMAVAVAVVDEFNRLSGHDYGLGAYLSAIVLRGRDRPTMGVEKHVRLVQSAFRLKWWERKGKKTRAAPNVIYGNERVFEQVVQDAVDEARGVSAAPAGRFTRTVPVETQD